MQTFIDRINDLVAKHWDQKITDMECLVKVQKVCIDEMADIVSALVSEVEELNGPVTLSSSGLQALLKPSHSQERLHSGKPGDCPVCTEMGDDAIFVGCDKKKLAPMEQEKQVSKAEWATLGFEVGIVGSALIEGDCCANCGMIDKPLDRNHCAGCICPYCKRTAEECGSSMNSKWGWCDECEIGWKRGKIVPSNCGENGP